VSKALGIEAGGREPTRLSGRIGLQYASKPSFSSREDDHGQISPPMPNFRITSQSRVPSVVAWRLVGTAATFGLVVQVARSLGAAGAGATLLAWTSAQFLSSICRLGTFGILLRISSQANMPEDAPRMRGIFLQTAIPATVVSLGIASVLTLQPDIPLTLFDPGSVSTSFIKYFAWSLPCLTLSLLISEVNKALGLTEFASLVQTGLANGLVLVGIFLLNPRTPNDIAPVFLFGSISCLLVSVIPAWKRVRIGIAEWQPAGSIIRSATPLLGYDLSRVISLWMPVLIVGILSDNSETGIFATASRTAMAGSLVAVSMSNLNSPRYARLHAEHRNHAIGDLARAASSGFLVSAAVIVPLTVVLAPTLFSHLGDDFMNATMVLAILLIAEVIRGATVPAVDILMMTQHEVDAVRNALFATAAIIAMSVPIVPAYGATGAALAVLLTTAFQGALNAGSVHHRIRIRTLPSTSDFAALKRSGSGSAS
jgi:O-antigen/teichoic acid export membrane protein